MAREEAGAAEPKTETPGASDASWVAASLRGDESAYAVLVQRYTSIVVGYCANRVRDYQAAEDLAQETFVKAYASLDRLKEKAKFGHWLLVIARHACMDWLRAKREAVSLDALREGGHEPETHGERPGVERAEDDEIRDAILREIDNLREDYRDILVMKHIDRLSYKEIGTLLGMSVSAVGEKLSRVRQILRRRLAPWLDESEPA